MNYLLDTSTFLWFIEGHGRLSPQACRIMESEEHDLNLSVASLWEMAIKTSLGKLELPKPIDIFIQQQLALTAVTLLDIHPVHAFTVVDLPFHHRDPFDRLLAAQCLCENLTLIGPDEVFDRYGISRTW